MPYHRYKPQNEYGRFFTRVFKHKLRLRREMDRQPFYMDPKLVEANIQVHDPLDPEFFKNLSGKKLEYQPPAHLIKKRDEDNPLYKANKSYLFEGKIGLTDGIDEACAIINASPARDFPERFYTQHPIEKLLPAAFADKIRDAIMHGEHYDPTLEKLPVRHDPILFWVKRSRIYGTPVEKRNNIILCNMYRLTLQSLLQKLGSLLSDYRCDFNAPLSSFIPSSASGFPLSLAFRQQPSMIIQLERPLTPLVDHNEVEETRSLKVPDVYPISPVIDLGTTHIYNDTPLIPRSIVDNLHIGSVFCTRVQDQKYPWTTEQNAANAILHCFGAAVAQATRTKSGASDFADAQSGTLRRPVLVKTVQLVDGRLDLVAVQLNTLNLFNREGAIKNLVWREKGLPLYKPKPYYENMLEVEHFDEDVMRKFVGFLLYR